MLNYKHSSVPHRLTDMPELCEYPKIRVRNNMKNTKKDKIFGAQNAHLPLQRAHNSFQMLVHVV